MREFEVIVIGTGVTGQTVAEELAAAGKRVAAVDRREFGGTCLLRGCEAKKVLYEAARAAERVAAQRGLGVTGAAAVDWPALIAFKRTFTDAAPAGVEAALSSSGAAVLHGEARFVDAGTLLIDGVRYAAEHIVVATGARPAPLGFDGEQHVWTSEQFLAAETLPERIVFIGGGYISMELSHIAAAAGARVTVCHRGERVLPGFDADLVDTLVRGYRESGVEVLTSSPAVSVARTAGGLEVELAGGRRLLCDAVVHGAGRVPDLGALDLDAGGVRHGPRGVEVDERLRSVSNPRVWAAGDAAARGLPLTPVGIAQGRVIVRAILGDEAAVFAPPVMPSVVFSDPPLAAVGLTEREAAGRGLHVVAPFHDQTQWASSRRVGARAAGAKVVVERGSDRVLGAHLLGHHADETINVFAAAIAGGLTAGDLKRMIWAYPTGGSEIVYLV